MISTIDIKCNAAHPEMPIQPLVAHTTSPSSIRVLDVPKKIGEWNITEVGITVKYPNNSIKSKTCVRIGNVWVGTIDGCSTSGTVSNGFTISANGLDEDGNEVNGYILGVGDVEVIQGDNSYRPDIKQVQIRLLDSMPTTPNEGDAYFNDGQLRIYTNQQWLDATDISGKRDLTDLQLIIPERGYIDYFKISNIPTQTIPQLIDKAEWNYTTKKWELQSPRYLGTVSIALDGGVYKLTYSGGTVTFSSFPCEIEHSGQKVYVWPEMYDGESLATRIELKSITPASIGAVTIADAKISNNLTIGFPELPKIILSEGDFEYGASIQVEGGLNTGGQIDVKGTGARITIDDKDVATEDYVNSKVPTKTSQLSNDTGFITASDIPTIGNATITIKQGTVTKGNFTLNGTSNKSVMLDAVPTKTTQLTNDSGFMTANDVVPQGTGTEVIATIGGKEIKAPAGGGGGGDSPCILYVNHTGDYSTQYVTYKIGNDNFKVYSQDGYVRVEMNENQLNQVKGIRKSYATYVTGNININFDGYSGDSLLMVDGVKTTATTIDTTGHHLIYVEMDECLHEDTLISMSDGTTKKVCELELGDKVKCLNPNTLQIDEDEVSFTDSNLVKSHNLTDIWAFDDGTVLKTIHPHQFFNVRTGKMEYIADFNIGDQVRKEDGTTTTLVSHTTKKGIVYHNTLYTKNFNNYFANGILTGNRKSVRWGWYWMEQNEQDGEYPAQ